MVTALHKFCENALKFGSATCFLVKDKKEGHWRGIGWKAVLNEVVALARGLALMGIRKGDLVAIFSNTRYEWTIIDLAVMSVGAVTVPIYHTLSPDQILYIIDHSSAKAIFVEDMTLLKKLDEIQRGSGSGRRVILIEGRREDVVCLSDFLKEGLEDSSGYYRDLVSDIGLSDVATCIYTSGTTGEPKGAELTHANIMGEVQGLREVFHFRPNEIGLLFLPLAHVIARAMQFYQLVYGCVTAYAESIDRLAANITEVKPHFMVVVPRIMEKIYERINMRMVGAPFLERSLFKMGVGMGRDFSQCVRRHEPVTAIKNIKGWFVRRILFARLHKKMGGRLGVIISGGAPLDRAIIEFFHAVGILVLEGYGLTETMAAVTINRPCDFKFGTVGKPLDGVQVKIADDGEVMVRGPQVFGNYREPVSDEEKNNINGGWLKTGDLGEFSRDGFLRITGRKKELIITAAGKNIAPQRVENMLKTSPYINDVIVFGDRRKYLSALVTLNKERVMNFAREKGLSYHTPDELLGDEYIYELIKSEIESKNKQLARHETVKKFKIIDHDFSQEKGELTPTLKLKRHKIYEMYKDAVDDMYE